MIKEFAMMAAFCIAFLAGIFLSVYWLSSSQCTAIADQMGLKSSYSLLTECMVEHKGKWLPLKAVRSLE